MRRITCHQYMFTIHKHFKALLHKVRFQNGGGGMALIRVPSAGNLSETWNLHFNNILRRSVCTFKFEIPGSEVSEKLNNFKRKNCLVLFLPIIQTQMKVQFCKIQMEKLQYSFNIGQYLEHLNLTFCSNFL